MAWAAGLYDGEGCTFLDKSGYLSMHVTQALPAVVRRFAKAVGVGKVYGPYKNHGQGFYKWQALSTEDAITTFELLKPYLSAPKKAQFREKFKVAKKPRFSWATRDRTRCFNGHKWTETNTYRHNGKRYCRTCRHDRYLARKAGR